MLSYTDRYVLNVLIDNVKADLKLSDVAASLAQGPSFALVYGFLALPLGRLADRRSRRSILLGSLAVWSVGTIACGLSSSLPALLASRFLVGVGEAGFFPCAVSFICDSFAPQRRGMALGTLLMGSALGSGLAVFVGGDLLAALNNSEVRRLTFDSSPWRLVLFAMGACGAPLLGLASFLREPARRKDGRSLEVKGGFLALLKDQGWGLGAVIAASALMAVLDSAASAWTPAFFMRRFSFTPLQIGTQLGTLTMIAGAAGYIVGGVVSDRLDRQSGVRARLLFGAICAAALLPMLAYTIAPATVSLALYAALTFTIAAFNVTLSAAFQRRVPNHLQGTATASLALILILSGLATGPTIVAFLTEHLLNNPALVGESIAIVGVFSLIPAAMMTLFARHK
jgi:MFS family permease